MTLPGQAEILDVNKIVESIPQKWYNQDLCQVNDCRVRMGIFEGEFHWHHHDKEDEFFFVLSGELLLDLPDETLTLTQNQGYTVPRGVEHRTRAKAKTIVLMVEAATVEPKGD